MNGEQSAINQLANNDNKTKNTSTSSSCSSCSSSTSSSSSSSSSSSTSTTTTKHVPLSATQFRRHEREHRHLVVAMDLARGLDSYNFSKLIFHVVLLWFAIPLLCNVIVYGVIPYQYPHIGVPSGTSRLSSVQPSSSPGAHALASESSTPSINIPPAFTSAAFSFQVPYLYTDPYNYGLPTSTSSSIDSTASSNIESNNNVVHSNVHPVNKNTAHTNIHTNTDDKTNNDINLNLFTQIEALVTHQHRLFTGVIQQHQSIVPSILFVMVGLTTLSMECYSNIISEIEFSVVLWEDTPVEYLKTGFIACFGALSMSFLVRLVMGDGRGFGLVGCLVGWLMMMCGGVVGIIIGLGSMFLRRRRSVHHHVVNHDPRSSSSIHDDMAHQEAKDVFVQCVRGLCMLLLVPPILYLIFGIVFMLYHEAYDGWLGIILAMGYPLVRLLIIFTVEQSQIFRWGYTRGNLCAGVQGGSPHTLSTTSAFLTPFTPHPVLISFSRNIVPPAPSLDLPLPTPSIYDLLT